MEHESSEKCHPYSLTNCSSCNCYADYYKELEKLYRENKSISDLVIDVHMQGIVTFLEINVPKLNINFKSRTSYYQLRNEWFYKERIRERQERSLLKAGNDLTEANKVKNIKKPKSCSGPSTKKTTSKNTKDVKLLKRKTKKRIEANEPKLGTLKRKRYNMEKLMKPNENYEDDLYENKKLYTFKKMKEYFIIHLKLRSTIKMAPKDSTSCSGLTTPKWSLPISPEIIDSDDSKPDEYYTSEELQNIRKGAQEYYYRRNKRRQRMRACKTSGANSSESKAGKDPAKENILKEAIRILRKQRCGEKEEVEDYYFSDMDEMKVEEP
ncbi:hypothetical protein CEXT_276291 [Caerostris extrusa]|uniref:Uncharacterized protein n=1 Tax=Caerostris extrusa TaxID=172846 RepID=A0AAV4PEX2_CAEEX|nr:hypothetical protein CEXT_276291 [Caerostris extrusa]